jgi:hypothetical protein
MRVVNDAVQYGVAQGWVADHGKMPLSLMEWYRRFGLFPTVMHCLGRSFR